MAESVNRMMEGKTVPTSTQSCELIRVDEGGVARITGTRMKVKQVSRENALLGFTVAEILEAHTHLIHAQVEAALDYYAAHKADIDAQIAEEDRLVAELRAKSSNPVTRTELLRRQRQLRAS